MPTPPVAAVAGGHRSIVELLLDRGADPNAPAGDGQPPLAATKWITDAADRDQIIALLRQRGATDWAPAGSETW